jgi:hypothetical protein
MKAWRETVNAMGRPPTWRIGREGCGGAPVTGDDPCDRCAHLARQTNGRRGFSHGIPARQTTCAIET